ncbi:MAG: peptidylprolyl isomerase [Hyphomicrobiales bacterium]
MKKILAILLLSILTVGSMDANNKHNKEKSEPVIVIHTNYGDITLKLYNDTPKHRDNFLKLVKEGWFNGSPFHRVINNFMIQGGQNKDGRLDPGYKIDAEILPNHIHKKGALAAARQADYVNPEKKSSGSQFYIVQGQKFNSTMLDQMAAARGVTFNDEQKKIYSTMGGTPHLDGDYTVFGEVIMGLDVVDKIAAVKTARGDRPVEEITMTIEVLE